MAWNLPEVVAGSGPPGVSPLYAGAGSGSLVTTTRSFAERDRMRRSLVLTLLGPDRPGLVEAMAALDRPPRRQLAGEPHGEPRR